uniref:G-protein alpha subunit n=1 Tax=Bursaphelenchus xylophilus TaxID=6326 RepID=A0A1I7SGE3_BURXY
MTPSLRILHNDGFGKYELEQKRSVVFNNIALGILEIVKAMPDLNLISNNPTFESYVEMVERYAQNDEHFLTFPKDIAHAVKCLWSDETVKEAFQHRSRFQCSDSVAHFLDSIDRVADPAYTPTNQDILHARVATTGVVEFKFKFNDINFAIYDVGGQRSERRKWIHFFDNVNGLLFVAAISEYDQTCREDNETNRLVEALQVFEESVNNKCFLKTSTILFLNKIDLFREKIKKVPLTVLYKQYPGGMDYENAIKFIRSRFEKVYRNPNSLYVHETCATDTKQVQKLFDAVLDRIVTQNLKETGMV